jgi:hypothetical protein
MHIKNKHFPIHYAILSKRICTEAYLHDDKEEEKTANSKK